MSLFRGKLFAGALFAGLLLAGNPQPSPAAPSSGGGGGGYVSASHPAWLLKKKKSKKLFDEIEQTLREILGGEPVSLEEVRAAADVVLGEAALSSGVVALPPKWQEGAPQLVEWLGWLDEQLRQYLLLREKGFDEEELLLIWIVLASEDRL